MNKLGNVISEPYYFTPDNSNVDYALRVTENNPDSLIPFDFPRIDPVDYIALASASFVNETYRFRVDGSRLTPQ